MNTIFINATDDIIKILEKNIFSDVHICFNCKKLTTKLLIKLFKYVLNPTKTEHIINSQMILNVLCLIKTYNKFNDSFFKNELIFFSDIEQFIDVKHQLKELILKLNCAISEIFISMLRSIEKQNMQYEDYYVLPVFYDKVFQSIDLVTLSEILATVPNNYTYDYKCIYNSNKYVANIAKTYVICDELISIFLEKINA